MRSVKFNYKKPSYENDDIASAFGHNGLNDRLKEIDVIVAEVCGENDSYPWYWILKMQNGTFSWATGNCDYTGWDCQSSAEIYDKFKTADKALEDLKIFKFEHRKGIKENLKSQLDEEAPFALFIEPE